MDNHDRPTKRVAVKHENEGSTDLAGIPMAPARSDGEGSSPQVAYEHGRQRQEGSRKRKRFGGSSITVLEGGHRVSAHYDRHNQQVDFSMQLRHIKLDTLWNSEAIEKAVFDRLNAAHFPIRPCEEWGFLGRRTLGMSGGVVSYGYADFFTTSSVSVYRDGSLKTETTAARLAPTKTPGAANQPSPELKPAVSSAPPSFFANPPNLFARKQPDPDSKPVVSLPNPPGGYASPSGFGATSALTKEFILRKPGEAKTEIPWSDFRIKVEG